MIYHDHAASKLSDLVHAGPAAAWAGGGRACGLAGSWRIRFVRQIRSDSTSAGHDLPNRPAPLAATGPRLAGTPAGVAALAPAERGGAEALVWRVMMSAGRRHSGAGSHAGAVPGAARRGGMAGMFGFKIIRQYERGVVFRWGRALP